MSVSLTHPSLDRARTSDRYRPAVSLRHPGRLTGWGTHRPGYYTHGRHLVTAVSCTCPLGAAGCEHSPAARTLAGQTAPEPMRRQPEQQAQDRDMSTSTATLTRDQAAATLAVTTDWVRRLVKAGKLTTVGADVTAASVDAYAQTRHATRFAKTPDTETARAIAAAKRAQTQAAALERKARKLRDAAKATYTRYGAGAHAGWLIAQGPSVDVAAHTRSGSWTAQPIAA